MLYNEDAYSSSHQGSSYSGKRLDGPGISRRNLATLTRFRVLLLVGKGDRSSGGSRVLRRTKPRRNMSFGNNHKYLINTIRRNLYESSQFS